MNSMDRWGPFASGLSTCERIARTRAFRAITWLITGSRGAALDQALAGAETDESFLDQAHAALRRLASLDRRKVLSSYAALARQAAPGAP